MTKTIVITSGKGGVGKTSVSVNAALELAGKGFRTCLFDADFGLANVNILLGIHPEKNLDDFIFRGLPLDEVIVATEYGIDVIPGSSGVEKMANLSPEQLASMVEAFAGLSGYDYFLIDTSSGISRGVISFCLAATETILVLTAESTSLADAYALLKVLSLNHYSGSVKILVNKCVSVEQAKKTYVHFKSVADKHLKISVVPGGAVLADSLIEKAVIQQRPVSVLFPDSMASQCIRALVANLVRTETAEDDGDVSAFWSRYFDIVQSDLHLPEQANNHVARAVSADIPEGSPEVVRPVIAEKEVVEEEDQERDVQSPHHGLNADLQPRGLVRGGLFAPLSLASPVPLLGAVLDLQESGQLSMAEMQKIILYDPALIGKILHAERPSPRSLEERTLSIRSVITELGERNVSKILLASATHGLLADWSIDKYMAVNSLWAHSCRCGQMAAALAEIIEYPYPEEAFLAGMLHDVGRLALLTCYPEIYVNQPFLYSHEQKILDAEIKIAGKTHAELGADILASWGLSSFIIDAARYHGETEARIATALDTAKLVYLADQLCSMSEVEMLNAVKLATTFFGLTDSQVFSCMQIVGYDLARVARGFNIPSSADIQPLEAESFIRKLRGQALDYVTLQSVLQYPGAGHTMDDILRSVHQGLGLLFGMNRVICLLPDSKETYLQAIGYTKRYDGALLENIRFYLKSPMSKIVHAYRTGKGGIVEFKECSAMADKQLINVMQSDGVFCMPLTAQGVRRGLIVCGLKESEFRYYTMLNEKITMFAAQVATTISLR